MCSIVDLYVTRSPQDHIAVMSGNLHDIYYNGGWCYTRSRLMKTPESGSLAARTICSTDDNFG